MNSGKDHFTEEQLQVLARYVTHLTGNVFVLRNLPEVIMGALFSRYSRSTLGLRALLLKEFIQGDGAGFAEIVGAPSLGTQHELAIQKAQNFYDRILDGYGDDSIGELGGAHVAIENISMLGAKIIEDCRIGGSPLEKSTRYVYFDQKCNGEYLFYRDPVLLASAFRDDYLEVCNTLFDTYSALIPPLTAQIEAQHPKELDVSLAAYNASTRAKVLDCLRGLLPDSALTNMGVFGNGRFWEGACHKLQAHNLAELQEVGADLYRELSKEIPSFVRRANPQHRHHDLFVQFTSSLKEQLNKMAKDLFPPGAGAVGGGGPQVNLIHYDPLAVYKVAAALLFSFTQTSFQDLERHCKSLSHETIAQIFDAASSMRENRRHKSPRALEHAEFTFEIIADFGIYRDLHRHRILTQERQLLTTYYGYFIPPEILGTDMENAYRNAMDLAAKKYEKIAKELPEEAQYIVPMAYNIRWYFHVNLRSLQWMCELRSAAQGHPTYRLVAQRLAQQVIQTMPLFESFFKFVDYEGYDLGRLGQEKKRAQKRGS